MRSASPGKPILGVEVSNVSSKGFWLLIDEREVFASFQDFPWFEEATIRQLTNLERPSLHHLYWPELDIDLAVDSIEHPDKYPLVSKARSNPRLQLTGRRRGGRGRVSQQKDGRARRTPRS
jgi:hypothetical protein